MAETVKVFEFNDIANPAANALLVTTGAVNEGAETGTNVSAFIQIYSTVDATFAVRVKNAAGTVIKTYKMIALANSRSVWGDVSMTFQLPNNWSIEIINVAAITGTVHGAIFLGLISGY